VKGRRDPSNNLSFQFLRRDRRYPPVHMIGRGNVRCLCEATCQHGRQRLMKHDRLLVKPRDTVTQCGPYHREQREVPTTFGGGFQCWFQHRRAATIWHWSHSTSKRSRELAIMEQHLIEHRDSRDSRIADRLPKAPRAPGTSKAPRNSRIAARIAGQGSLTVRRTPFERPQRLVLERKAPENVQYSLLT
jgi:hypothetical protein